MEMLNIMPITLSMEALLLPGSFHAELSPGAQCGSWLVGVSFMGCVTKLHDTDIAHLTMPVSIRLLLCGEAATAITS